MADKSNVHQQLVNSICDATVAALKPQHEQLSGSIAYEFANVNTLLGSVIARLEVFECGGAAGGGGGGGGAKRAPRGERKTGAAAAKKPPIVAADADVYSAVKNAWLFCRRMWVDDEGFRARYSSASTAAAIEADEKSMKCPEGSLDRLLAEGSVVWRKGLTDAQQESVRAEFRRWKEERKKQALEDPLAADSNAEDGANSD